ncbi:MAG: RNA methyltransferase [Saprospiraceae bacterium]
MPLSKNIIKSVTALHLKKFRQKYDKFIAEGEKIVQELLSQSVYEVEAVFGTEEWASKHIGLLQNRAINFTVINDKELSLISQMSTPNKVLAIVKKPAISTIQQPLSGWSIYLDGVQDPGNVGTILRIADWFGLPRVIAGPGTVELYNTKVLQATMGAFLRVTWLEASLRQVKQFHPALPVWVADMAGTDVFELTVPTTGVLVVGNEGQGVTELSQQLATQLIAITAPAGGGAESLNVAVATGILCAALTRKNR